MLLPFDRVRNTLSASVPVMYKFTESDPANATQSLQAFSMQLFIYTLLRSFVFFLVRKQLVAVPSRHGSPVPLAAELMASPSLTSFSPQPLSPNSVGSALPAGYVADASAALGIAMDGFGDDIEFKKTVNAPTIAVDERVEITRVNRWGLVVWGDGQVLVVQSGEQGGRGAVGVPRRRSVAALAAGDGAREHEGRGGALCVLAV